MAEAEPSLRQQPDRFSKRSRRIARRSRRKGAWILRLRLDCTHPADRQTARGKRHSAEPGGKAGRDGRRRSDHGSCYPGKKRWRERSQPEKTRSNNSFSRPVFWKKMPAMTLRLQREFLFLQFVRLEPAARAGDEPLSLHRGAGAGAIRRGGRPSGEKQSGFAANRHGRSPQRQTAGAAAPESIQAAGEHGRLALARTLWKSFAPSATWLIVRRFLRKLWLPDYPIPRTSSGNLMRS